MLLELFGSGSLACVIVCRDNVEGEACVEWKNGGRDNGKIGKRRSAVKLDGLSVIGKAAVISTKSLL